MDKDGNTIAVLTHEERALLAAYRRCRRGDAEFIYGLTSDFAQQAEAIQRPSLRLVKGGQHALN